LNRRFSFVFLGYLAGKVPPVINLGKKRETCEKPQSARGLKATQNIDENNVIDVDKSKHVTLLFWLVTCVKKAVQKNSIGDNFDEIKTIVNSDPLISQTA
jgi:hypothetical protein